MNWTVIGLLVIFIVASLTITIYAIFRLIDNRKELSNYLNYYESLSNKYGLQLTRISEGIEEFEKYNKDLNHEVLLFIHNIKSLVKLAGK